MAARAERAERAEGAMRYTNGGHQDKQNHLGSMK